MKLIAIITLAIGAFQIYKFISGKLDREKHILSNATVLVKDYFAGGQTKGVFVRGAGFVVPVADGYRITFELENHKNATFIVPEKLYNSVSVGSTGVLEADGKNFVKFTLDAPDSADIQEGRFNWR